MSKQTKRKITVELPKVKELQTRPSVFERLGTKRTGTGTGNITGQITQQISLIQTQIPQTELTGISTKPPTPPKEPSAPVEENKGRLHSAVVVREEDDAEWDSWNQTDLEKRRQQLCRELGMAMEASKKKKKPIPSSSSSSRSSSSGSASSSSSGSNSSSSSSPRRKKVKKTVKSKRNSSSSSGSDRGSRRKKSKLDLKRDKSSKSKVSQKKDTSKLGKKIDSSIKKKVSGKSVLNKKSLSPPKKTSTPPINKNIPKGYILSKRAHSKSPKKDKNRSPSPHSKEKARDRERRERDRDRDRERRRSKSPKNKARSRSPLRRHGSHPRDPRRKSSRGPSPKRGRQDDKHRNKRSPSRDDKRKDHKDRSLERRKHDDKERYDRDRKDRDQRFDREAQREKEREEALARCQERQRERERLKEQQNKREQEKRPRGRDRDRGLDKGLEKPTPDKPVERLLPRPEERLAALAATNRNLGRDRAISSNRDRSETRPDHNVRKGDRPADGERKRPAERRSVERHDRNEYSMDRSYDHSLERNYDRSNERYDEIDAIGERPDHSPSGFPPGHEHYDSPYEHRGYGDQEEHSYDEHIDERHEERRDRDRRDDRSWDGRENSVDPDRPYIHHSMKDWDNDDYHGDWNRQDRHWQHRDQHHDWNDKDRDEGSWHHRQVHSGSGSSSRGRPHDENYRGRMEHGRGDQGSRTESRVDPKSKRSRDVPAEPSDSKKGTPTQSQSNVTAQPEISEDPPIPDDLSEISDDPDEILNREDDQTMETTDLTTSVCDTVDHFGLQPFKPDYEPMIEQEGEKTKTNSSESPGNNESQLTNSVNKEAKETDKEKVESQEQNDGEDGLDNLDFEEISDGELEEDQRAKGLSDALGVDWASLVAEVRAKKPSEDAANKEATGARQYWEPNRVLARIGVSVYMAGKSFVEEVYRENNRNKETQGNGESTTEQTCQPIHPIACMQVAMERKKNQRAALFGTNRGFSRALSARQDLALRRYLCNLPINEGAHEIESLDPQFFAIAQKLIQEA